MTKTTDGSKGPEGKFFRPKFRDLPVWQTGISAQPKPAETLSMYERHGHSYGTQYPIQEPQAEYDPYVRGALSL